VSTFDSEKSDDAEVGGEMVFEQSTVEYHLLLRSKSSQLQLKGPLNSDGTPTIPPAALDQSEPIYIYEHLGEIVIPGEDFPTEMNQGFWKAPSADVFQDIHILQAEDIVLNLGKCIGKGNFGEVYIGLFRGSKCAFKRSHGNAIESYASENMLFKQISTHPCICRYFGICKYDNSFFLVMEYFPDGCLLGVVQNHHFMLQEKIYFCHELSKGLWHLHSEGVLHGDLALRNVLIDRRINPNRVVLTDFGQSCRYPCTEPQQTLCPRWCSPPLMRTRIFTRESDVWALAMCFWELFLDGRRPYDHLKGKAVISRLIEGILRPNCGNLPGKIRTMLNEVFENPGKETLTAKWLYQNLQSCMEEFGSSTNL